ncbi:MAG: hypothetical protein ACTHNS_15670 [Marmoricola sp.]
MRLNRHGAVSGWAALRWRGAAFFDGTTQGGRMPLPVPLPVPLVVGQGNLRTAPEVSLSWEQLAPYERDVVAGLACATGTRALFDEVRRTRSLVAGVVAVDMAAAAGVVGVAAFSDYVDLRNAWTGVIHARRVVALAIDDSRSPPESVMRLVWVLDAGLPPPLCNQPVFDLDGTLLGHPDLFDPEAGLVGEYDGADHLEDDRRRSDRQREERFRDHGLEYFAVVKGELSDPAAVGARMLGARRRARWLPPERRAWTLEWPTWYPAWRAARGWDHPRAA